MVTDTRKDCWSCRLIGSGSFLGVSLYAAHIGYEEAQKKQPDRFTPLNSLSEWPRKLKLGFLHGPMWMRAISCAMAGLAVGRLVTFSSKSSVS